MKFKKIIILIGCMVLLATTACEDFLNEEPRSLLTTETFFTTDAEAELAINGLYSLLHVQELYRNVHIDRFYQFGADELGANRAENTEEYDYNYNEASAWIYESYKAMYEIIRNASLFISSIDGNENLSEGVRNQTLGEALFLRALMYWHLTNLWGDVPYFRELLSVDELATLERTDHEIIRVDMRADLDRAFELLSGYPPKDLGRATKWAAKTLKAKFYMKRKAEMTTADWQGMFDESVQVINESEHRLLDNYEDVLDMVDPLAQYNDEIIFAVDFYGRDAVHSDFRHIRNNWFNPRIKKDEPKQKNDPAIYKAFTDTLASRNENMRGYGKMIPLPGLANQANWEDGDMRYEATVIQNYLGFELKYPYFKKLWNLDQEFSARGNSSNNFVVFRLADVYLMAAEAANELSGPANAYQFVNKVRERAFEPDKPWSGMSQDEFRIKLRDERKFELSGESYRKWDLIRWDILVETVKNMEVRPHNNPAANVSEKHNYYPLPEEEILLNPNLLNSDPSNNGWRE